MASMDNFDINAVEYTNDEIMTTLAHMMGVDPESCEDYVIILRRKDRRISKLGNQQHLKGSVALALALAWIYQVIETIT